jgi:hypothetical protein
MASIHDRHRRAATWVRRETGGQEAQIFPAHEGLVRIHALGANKGVELQLHEEVGEKAIKDFLLIQLSRHQALDLVQGILRTLERTVFEACSSEEPA